MNLNTPLYSIWPVDLAIFPLLLVWASSLLGAIIFLSSLRDLRAFGIVKGRIAIYIWTFGYSILFITGRLVICSALINSSLEVDLTFLRVIKKEELRIHNVAQLIPLCNSENWQEVILIPLQKEILYILLLEYFQVELQTSYAGLIDYTDHLHLFPQPCPD